MRNQSKEKLLPPILDLKIKGYKMHTCFLLTHVPDPKTNKRINVFKEQGKTSVICTRRKSQDIWEPAYDDVPHYIYDVDLPTVKHIIKRYIVSKRYQKKALQKLKELHPDVIYADGLDSLMIASTYKSRYEPNLRLFYDVADLRETYIEPPKNVIKRLLNAMVKQVEKKKFAVVDFLVVTSEKFYDVYYYKLIDKNKVIFIPNAPDREVFSSYKKKTEGEFTVGFIGGIRYLDQMKMLVDAASEIGCHVLFAGAGGTSDDYANITAYCTGKPQVTFTGKYDYKNDIARLYGQVDCVFAVYDADNPNVRIALPNKLYESILCELPILVAKGTYLSELVEKWGVGISVGHRNQRELEEALRRLCDDASLKEKIQENCRNLKGEMGMEKYAPFLANASSGN